MFMSSIRILLRSLKRDRAYALVNLVGLVAGISCFLILSLYLRSELSYDQHFDNHDRLYRLATDIETSGKLDQWALSSMFVAEYLKRDHADVIDHVRIQYLNRDPNERSLLKNGDNAFYWDNVVLGEQNLFELFSHDILYGDPATALIDPLSIAISETMAKQYFGQQNPIGETLQADTATYKVTLVYADLPDNTHAKYDAVISFNRVLDFLPENFDATRSFWGMNLYTYLYMPENYAASEFGDISDAFSDKYLQESGGRLNSRQTLRLEPLADIHLGSTAQADRPTGNRFYIYTFAAIAVLLLLVACINYMNLATARSVKRAKEIGMRKVVGASRRQLVAQFMGESVVFAVIATAIAVGVVQLLLQFPALTALLGQSVSLDLWAEPWMLGLLLVLALTVGVFSGLYPALYLSFIKPIAALKGSFKAGSTDLNMRQALVLIQFTISVGVIACTILMALQMSYVNNKPLGFDKANRIVMNLKGADAVENFEFIKNDLKKNSDILGVTLTGSIPGTGTFRGIFAVQNNAGATETHTMSGLTVDEDFFDVMGIEMVDGRPFNLNDGRRAMIVNETAVRQLGWDSAIGKRFGFANSDSEDEPITPPTVVGVVKDFHYESLHNRIGPMVVQKMRLDFENIPTMQRPLINMNVIVKTTGKNPRQTLDYIRDRWPQYDAKHPFEYRFLDDTLNDLYVSEQTQMRLIGVFAVICIVISCLGLFGLTAFTTQQRTREIGIRKILGATTARIVLLFFKSTIGVIAVASILASAVSYYVVSQWLAGYEYTTGINVFVFVFAALIALAVAFLTIVLQSYKTASASPIQALRYE